MPIKASLTEMKAFSAMSARSVEEIAKHMQVSSSTVRTMLSNGSGIKSRPKLSGKGILYYTTQEN